METERVIYWKNKPEWTIYDLVFLLQGIDPKPYYRDGGSIPSKIQSDLQNWAAWAPGCPLLSSLEQRPLTRPVNARKLLAWAASLEGINIPEYLTSLLPSAEVPVPSPGASEPTQGMGDLERENLFLTIGTLALALVEKSGPALGSLDKPNVSQLAEACMKQAGEASGMGRSTVRQRISDGIRILNDRR